MGAGREISALHPREVHLVRSSQRTQEQVKEEGSIGMGGQWLRGVYQSSGGARIHQQRTVCRKLTHRKHKGKKKHEQHQKNIQQSFFYVACVLQYALIVYF